MTSATNDRWVWHCCATRLRPQDWGNSATRFRTSTAWRRSSLLGSLVVLMVCASASADDWPQWRGPEGINHADADITLPIQWDLKTGQNVIWKTALPGFGHSTPIVVENSIFLTTADEAAGTQSLVRLDRETGRVVDQWVIHRGGLPGRIHPKNSHASPSPAYDGRRIFVAFHQSDAIWVTALTAEGQIIWQQRVCDFRPSSFQFGYGASPIVEGDVVIVAAEYDGPDSGLYGLDVGNGDRVWKVARPENLNFASPITATIAGQRQILIAGAEKIAAYRPQTGVKLWDFDASTEAICGTIVWDGRRVLISGGNPDSGTWCIRAAGPKKLLWENNVKCYEQSMLTINGYVFAIADSGVAYCWRTVDGKEMWKRRLFGGGISASPLLIGDELLIAAEDGRIFTIAAIPDRFDLLAENQAGDKIFASPIAVDDRLYVRTSLGEPGEQRQYLVAIGRQ